MSGVTELVVVEESDCDPRLYEQITRWMHDPLLGKNVIHIGASREACPTIEETEA